MEPENDRRAERGPAGSIIYIGGYGRSGSTVVELELAAGLRFLASGELNHLFKWTALGLPCGCGASLAECDYWSPTVAGIAASTSVESAAETTRSVERPFGTRSDASDQYAAIWSHVVDRCLTSLPVAGLVDSSKTSGGHFRAMRLADIADSMGVFYLFVHLTRDPRAVAHSASRGSNLALEGFAAPSRSGWPAAMRAGGGWLKANLVAFVVRKRLGRDRSTVIRYETMANDVPGQIEELVSRLQPFVGTDEVEPNAVTGHGIAGNRFRRADGPHPTMVEDASWRQEMGWFQRGLFGLLVPVRWLLER